MVFNNKFVIDGWFKVYILLVGIDLIDDKGKRVM